MSTKSIRQTVTFKASPHDVYELIMDSRKHAAFTGGKASVSRKVGGKFNVFDGYAEGKNLELVPDALIKQTWRASDWSEGIFSTVTFKFEPVNGATRMTFTQAGIPEDQHEAIAQGWRDYYWAPMKEALKQG